ncbi:MAG: hypothetical protein HYR63_25035 [Proteobacteria bacterium]|nr:hypothetical protein [Pseudomonadota bacterium]MBI3497194.1 hypothetical protein [Pseudomonadota bacterium]
MYADGIRLGQCGVLTGRFAIHLDAIMVAISRVAYRRGSDYLGLTVIRQFLVQHGLQPWPPETGVDKQPDQINLLLKTAANLPWSLVLASGSYIPVFDLGYVDYAATAFRLFGLRIEALYYLYFAILGISSAAFCIAFYENPAAICSLAMMLLTLRWLKRHLTIFDESKMNYVYSYHFLSTLTVVPGFHVILSVLSLQDLGWAAIATGAIQIYVAYRSLRIRYGASWVLFATAAATLSVLVLHSDRIGRLTQVLAALLSGSMPVHDLSGGQLLSELAAGLSGVWLVGALVLCFVGLSWGYKRRLSPVYGTDEVIDHYPRYHGAYLGLTMDADTWKGNMQDGQFDHPQDLNGIFAAKYWLLSTPGAGVAFPQLKPELSAYHSNLWDFRWRTYEQIIRLAFFDYVRKNWQSLPRLYAICKPHALLTALAEALSAVFRGLRRDQPFESVLMATVASIATGIAYTSYASGPVAAAILWIMLAAPAPQIWAYTIRHSLADQLWVAFFAPWLLLLWIIASGVQAVSGL